jgi:peptidoglycan/LPS O-acetylase OafA/YrhL
MKKLGVRQSNMELLRIIAMFFIVTHHYVWNGKGYCPDISMPGLQAIFFVAGGSLGINLFMLISGYFLGGGMTQFKTKRLMNMICTVWSYS